jgi:protein involved in polysaccharide export with SLBB domain
MQKSPSTIHHQLSTIHYALFTFLLILLAGQQALAQTAVSGAENDKPSFTIEGEVLHAGSFPLTKNFRVKDAVKASGGLTKDADSGRAEIIRFNKRQKNYYTIYFQVANALSGDLTDNFVLLDKDRVVIHKIQKGATLAQPERRSVSISGQIAKPGDYPYTVGMTVKDLVLAGGNTLKTSYPDEAEIFSIVSDGDKLYSSNRKIIHLQKAMEGDPKHNIKLKPDDRLFIKMIPDVDALLESVSVTGEFRLPGKYPITKGERLSSVIMRAGGYGPNAYLRGAVFNRERVRQFQQISLDRMIALLERDLQEQNPSITTGAQSAEEEQKKNLEADGKTSLFRNMKTTVVRAGGYGLNAYTQGAFWTPQFQKSTLWKMTMQLERDLKKHPEADLKMKLLRDLKAIKAKGRIPVALKHVRLMMQSSDDVELENGDTLYLPPNPGIVKVAGAVAREGSYLYHEKWDYRDYIAAAGGYTGNADKWDIFIIKADGISQRPTTNFFERLCKKEDMDIESGDVIVAPEGTTRPAWFREIADIIQIFKNEGVVQE